MGYVKKIRNLMMGALIGGFFFVMPHNAFAAEGNVAIDDNTFPDDNFRSYVSSVFDTNSDGRLSQEEIDNVRVIDVSYHKIKSLLGVEIFTSLTKLSCYKNNLTSLDVSKNTALIELSCHNNDLTSLNVSKNTALTKLSCGFNDLTNLDVSQNTALTSLDCCYNKLTNLDVSQNTALTDLKCYNNDLTSLDVSKNTALTTLSCFNNNLTSLDVSKNTSLGSLLCENNNLTNLDVSMNTALYSLNCSNNNLTDLDVSKNTALGSLFCDKNKISSLDLSNNSRLVAIVKMGLDVFDYEDSTVKYYADCNPDDGFIELSLIIDMTTQLLTEAVAPAAPANVLASVANGQVTLKWDASAGATKYAVYRKTGSDSWEKLSSRITKTTFIDKTATVGKKCAYYVRAYNEAGWSGRSSIVKVSIPLGAPKNMVTTTSEGKVTVTWSKVDGAEKYALYRRMNEGNTWSSWVMISASLTNSKYVDTAVASNTEYQYRVKAYSEAGWGSFKVSEKVKTPISVPDAPEAIKTVAYTGKVAVSWSTVEGATKYRLYRRVQQGGTWTSWETVSTQKATSYADKDVTSGNVYQYRVRAYNDAGWSNSTLSQNVNYSITAPATIKAVGYTGKVAVSWSAVDGATKYTLFRRVYNGSSWGTWEAVMTNRNTSYADKDVTAGTKYQYKVRAYTASGWSGFTVSSAVTPK